MLQYTALSTSVPNPGSRRLGQQEHGSSGDSSRKRRTEEEEEEEKEEEEEGVMAGLRQVSAALHAG